MVAKQPHQIRLIIVDGKATVRAGMRMRLALEPEIEVVGEAADARGGVALAEHLQPDVILLDVALPGSDGITAIARLRQVAPRSAVVVVTLHGGDVRGRAMAAGAAAFVGKHEADDALLAAIRMQVQSVARAGSADQTTSPPPNGGGR